jgi:hypothetical protein
MLLTCLPKTVVSQSVGLFIFRSCLVLHAYRVHPYRGVWYAIVFCIYSKIFQKEKEARLRSKATSMHCQKNDTRMK